MEIERVCRLICEPVSADCATEQTRLKPLTKQLYDAGPESLTIARKWFQKAACGGCVCAMRYLALMLFLGRGGPKDTDQARMWFQKAAEGGDVLSMGIFASQLKSRGTRKDMADARIWLRKAASANDVTAMCELVAMLRAGEGYNPKPPPPRPLPKGVKPNLDYIQKLYKHLNYRKSANAKEDRKEARMWLRKAAEAGNVQAMHDLAQMFAKGEGGLHDDAEARAWQQRAADCGHEKAMLTVISQLESGQGGPRDIVGALAMAKRANHTAAINRMQPLLACILLQRRKRIIFLCLARQRLLQRLLRRCRTAATATPPLGRTMATTTTPQLGHAAAKPSTFGRTTATPLGRTVAITTPPFSHTMAKKKTFGHTMAKTPPFGHTMAATPPFGHTATPPFDHTATPPFGHAATAFVAGLVLSVGYDNSLWGRVCAFWLPPLGSFDPPHHQEATLLMAQGFSEQAVYRALRKADWDFDRAMRQLVKHSKRHKKHHEKHHEKHHDRETRVQDRHHERHFFWHRSGVDATDQIIREGRHHDREGRHHARHHGRHRDREAMHHDREARHHAREGRHHGRRHGRHHDREARRHGRDQIIREARHHDREARRHGRDQIIREARHHDREARHHDREARRHGRERRVQEKGRVQERQGDQTDRNNFTKFLGSSSRRKSRHGRHHGRRHARHRSGVVKRWNKRMGHGLIKPKGRIAHISCHSNDIIDGNALCEGDTVRFTMQDNPKCPGEFRAANVTGGVTIDPPDTIESDDDT